MLRWTSARECDDDWNLHRSTNARKMKTYSRGTFNWNACVRALCSRPRVRWHFRTLKLMPFHFFAIANLLPAITAAERPDLWWKSSLSVCRRRRRRRPQRQRRLFIEPDLHAIIFRASILFAISSDLTILVSTQRSILPPASGKWREKGGGNWRRIFEFSLVSRNIDKFGQWKQISLLNHWTHWPISSRLASTQTKFNAADVNGSNICLRWIDCRWPICRVWSRSDLETMTTYRQNHSHTAPRTY